MKKTFIIALMILTGGLQAQTAQEIIAKHRKATGADLRSNIKTMHMWVTIENPNGGSIPMHMYIQRPDKVSINMEVMGQKLIMVQNGIEAWMINPMVGTDPTPIPDNQKGQLTQALDDMDGQFADYLEKPENYEYLGMEEVEGIRYYKIKMLNDPRAQEAVIFFDETSYYPLRQEVMVQGQKAVNKMSDFRVISGIHIPFEITTTVDGTIASKMVVQEVTINQTLDASVFRKP